MPSAADKLLSLTSRASSAGSIHTSWLLSGERAPFGPVEPLRTYLLRARQARCRLTRISGRTAPPCLARSGLARGGRARRMAAVRPFRGVYYGWVIVGGLALISVASGAMGNLTVALFIQPMTDDLGISKLEFGLAQSARLLGFGASGWFLGRILDRHGARIPLAIAGALGGLVAVGLASLSSGWQIMPLFFAAGLLGLQGGTSLYGTVP